MAGDGRSDDESTAGRAVLFDTANESKGYDDDPLSRRLWNRGIELISPYRSNNKSRVFEDGRKLRRYKRRYIIERTNSWFELTTGYSYARFDQGRYDYSGSRYDSKVDDHLFRFGMSLGRDFRRENSRWTPIAGLDYTWIDQRGYRERGDGNLGLTVRGDELNSLRIRLGAEMERQYGK